MTSPNKRRKKSHFDASSKGTRSLDHYFAKRSANDDASPAAPVAGDIAVDEAPKDTVLTDEELARNLQAQWDQEASSGQFSKSAEDSFKVNCPAEAKAHALPTPSTPTSARKTLSLQCSGAEEDLVSSRIDFDRSPTDFDPQDWIPGLQEQWAPTGGQATYALLTRCFVLVNGAQSRIKIVDTLVNVLRTIIEAHPPSLLPAVSCFCADSWAIGAYFLGRSGSRQTPSPLPTLTSSLAWEAPPSPKR